MSTVRRVYVEKKPEFAIKAKDLKHEIKHYLNIQTVTNVRELIRYDVENISDETYEKACKVVFAEPPVDICYQEDFPRAEGARVFSVEFLPGQFDQRADSAVQCVQFLKEDEQPIIRSAVTYVIEGEMTDEQFDAVKAHCINPVDSRETGLEKPETLVTKFEEPADVKIFDGFIDMPEAELKALYDSLGLAMTFKDFLHIQNYFRGEEKRNPSMTEIRVLDTYWSDHCRHTTFSTELTNVTFGEGDYYEPMKKSYDRYLSDREVLYKGRDDKFICLMEVFKDRRVEFFPCPVIYMLIFYRPCKCRCPKQHTVDQEARAVGVAVVVGDKIRFPDKIQHQMTRHYPQDQMHLIIL